MQKLHSATAKSAKANNIDLRSTETGEWDAVDIHDPKNERTLATNEDPKVALKTALKFLDDEANGTEGSDDEDEREAPGNIVPKVYRDRYKEHNDTCGDSIAQAISGFINYPVQIENKRKDKNGNVTYRTVSRVDPDKLVKLAADNSVMGRLEKFAHLNPGQQRMNLGNVLRGMVYQGEFVTIGDVEFNLREDVEFQLGDKDSLNKTQIKDILKNAGLPITDKTFNAIGRIAAAIVKARNAAAPEDAAA